jgi:hypothetical protein
MINFYKRNTLIITALIIISLICISYFLNQSIGSIYKVNSIANKIVDSKLSKSQLIRLIDLGDSGALESIILINKKHSSKSLLSL